MKLKTALFRFQSLRYVKFTGKAAVDTTLMHDRSLGCPYQVSRGRSASILIASRFIRDTAKANYLLVLGTTIASIKIFD